MSKKKKTIEFTVRAKNRLEPTYRVQIEPNNPITKCTIHTLVSGQVWGLLSYGISVRKHGDPYDKEIGCRMALRSALKTLENSFPKQIFWESYLEIFPVSLRNPQPKLPSHRPDHMYDITPYIMNVPIVGAGGAVMSVFGAIESAINNSKGAK